MIKNNECQTFPQTRDSSPKEELSFLGKWWFQKTFFWLRNCLVRLFRCILCEKNVITFLQSSSFSIGYLERRSTVDRQLIFGTTLRSRKYVIPNKTARSEIVRRVTIPTDRVPDGPSRTISGFSTRVVLGSRWLVFLVVTFLKYDNS